MGVNVGVGVNVGLGVCVIVGMEVAIMTDGVLSVGVICGLT